MKNAHFQNFRLMEYYSNDTSKNSARIDAETVKTHYARDNNDKILSFVLQEDPNLLLDWTSIEIGMTVDIPDGFVPDNGFASKLFANLSVEIDSQLITSTKAK